MEELESLFSRIIGSKALIKAVFSRAKDKNVVKAACRVVEIRNERMIQTETFLRDGKALQRNISEQDAARELTALAGGFRQIDLITSGGTCEILISKSGACHISNGIKEKLLPVSAGQNDRAHSFTLDPARASSFLFKLGVCDEKGRIFDRKRSKFKQINRFVEILDDCYRFLPEKETLTVCDLCCGKSYLTFAVYYYLTEIKGRKVEMYGVDLKMDVIDFCSETARELGFDGMHFSCGDVSRFDPPARPDLVISLHACDTATDVVIYNVLRLGAKVALLTPCCHHEMNAQLSCQSLSFVSDYSMYRQKLCDALTDALRCKCLEANGYKVTALELIDPEETPKNILIKAIRANLSASKREEAARRYREAVDFLGVRPYLDVLLREKPLQTQDGPFADDL